MVNGGPTHRKPTINAEHAERAENLLKKQPLRSLRPLRLNPYRPGSGFVRSWLVAVVAVWLAAISIPTAADNTPARGSIGEVGLLDAAERGDRATALRLLTKGANPNAPGPDGTHCSFGPFPA